uniref:Endoplasmic reticulum lectin 1 n=1 Tax=Schistosoma japonicum TaxID=6182 RepID=C1L560_SCHJA|nr:XTP3-transactivated gene B protein precursor [Schistosoma japonicum]
MMRQIDSLFVVLIPLFFPCVITVYNVTEDIVYDFEWPGSSQQSREKTDVVKVRTTVGEIYECYIPILLHDTQEYERQNSVPVDEKTILQPLFSEHPCVVRSEAYWSYELCHNQYIKQFHEERKSGKSSPVQEYYLGHYYPSSKTERDRSTKDNQPKSVTLGEHSYPYYEVNYVDGTLCDLNQQHRTTTVMYICHESTIGQIVDVSEVRTCHYQVVFATKFLCSIPLYEQKRAHTNPISCHSKDSSPSKPSALIAMEAERKKLQSNSFSNLAALLSDALKSKIKLIEINSKRDDTMLVYQVNFPDDADDESTTLVDVESNADDSVKNIVDSSSISPSDSENQAPSLKTSSSSTESITKSAKDNQVKEFLQGKTCLSINSGWWTYEICFNDFVRQYHLDANAKKLQEILLGTWNLEEHLKWLAENAKDQKSSTGPDRQISLYYGHGDYCTESGTFREVVVKLKCIQSTSTAIYLSFSEHTKCVYSMTIESSTFCDLLPLADENNIIPINKV